MEPMMAAVAQAVHRADLRGAVDAFFSMSWFAALVGGPNVSSSFAFQGNIVCEDAAEAYKTATDPAVKTQLLSLLLTFPQQVLILELGVSRRQIRKAKKLKGKNDGGTISVEVKHTRFRFKDENVFSNLLHFIYAPSCIRRAPTLAQGGQGKTEDFFLKESREVLWRAYWKDCQATNQTAVSRSVFLKELNSPCFKNETIKTCLCACCYKGFECFASLKDVIPKLCSAVDDSGMQHTRWWCFDGCRCGQLVDTGHCTSRPYSART